MAPTVSLPEGDSESPTTAPTMRYTLAVDDLWYASLLKSREHEGWTTETNDTDILTLEADDDDALFELDRPQTRKLGVDSRDSWYEADLGAEQRLGNAIKRHVREETATDVRYAETPTSLEDMLREEHRLEVVVQEQEAEKEQKRTRISNMRKDRTSTTSEILQLELELERVERASALRSASK